MPHPGVCLPSWQWRGCSHKIYRRGSHLEWINGEDNFFDEGYNGWELDAIYNGRFIPTRAEDGSPSELAIKIQPAANSQMNNWTQSVRYFFGSGSGKPFKPSRHLDLGLKHPLLIEPLNIHAEMVNSRFGGIEKLLRFGIEQANGRGVDDNGNRKWQLKYCTDHPETDYRNYNLVSKGRDMDTRFEIGPRLTAPLDFKRPFRLVRDLYSR
jgi:hypothetical protein